MKQFGSRTEIEYMIDEYIVGMVHAQRNRAIMKLRYIDGLTYSKIAEMYELSDWQVKNIIYECERILNRH